MSKICKNCGAEVPDSVKFCPACGNDMESYEGETQTAEAKPN